MPSSNAGGEAGEDTTARVPPHQHHLERRRQAFVQMVHIPFAAPKDRHNYRPHPALPDKIARSVSACHIGNFTGITCSLNKLRHIESVVLNVDPM